MSKADVLSSSAASLNVYLSAIIDNYQTLAGLSSSADCAAVVKANAYGLGMEQVASALFNKTDCKIFFVANLVEALSLRVILPEAIIYVLNGLCAGQIDTYLDHNIRPILNDLDEIALWNERSEPCAIHFDTGINRLGLSESATEKFLGGTNDLNIVLILSHLVRSEEAKYKTNKIQLKKFKKIRAALPHIPASLANSAGIYLGEEYHFDLLRPGIMLYGGNPGLAKLPDGIKNTFEIKANILQIRNLEPGMSVGYNALWTAEHLSRVAILNVGYADGTYKTNDLSYKVYLHDTYAPVIGKVSMDLIAIDITGPQFDHIKVEDEVELMGPNITLEMAAQGSTLGQYELLTGVGQRYNKNYILGADT